MEFNQTLGEIKYFCYIKWKRIIFIYNLDIKTVMTYNKPQKYVTSIDRLDFTSLISFYLVLEQKSH